MQGFYYFSAKSRTSIDIYKQFFAEDNRKAMKLVKPISVDEAIRTEGGFSNIYGIKRIPALVIITQRTKLIFYKHNPELISTLQSIFNRNTKSTSKPEISEITASSTTSQTKGLNDDDLEEMFYDAPRGEDGRLSQVDSRLK